MSEKKSYSTLLFDTALRYAKLGLSVIPTNEDKRPTVKWKGYQDHIAPEASLKSLFTGNAYGIAVICGRVSGNLEIIDVDSKYDISGNMYAEFCAIVEKLAAGLTDKLLVEKTTGGGFHIIYRCSQIEGNLKLASRPATDEEKQKHPDETQKVLFETRGEGGYFVCAPTNGYEFIRGSFENIPEITSEERDILFQAAASFEQLPRVFQSQNVPPQNTFSLSPFDDYTQRGDCVALLQKHGWIVTLDNGSKIFLKRPGDTKSKQSGNFDRQKNWFTVFSTSTVFEIRKAYKPCAVFALLECNNDFKEAAKRLYEMGYGEGRNNAAIQKHQGKSFSTDPFFRQAYIDGYIDEDFDYKQTIISANDLVKMDCPTDRYLIEGLCPKTGVGLLVGKPDVGKSNISRQLALAIALGLNDFLGFKLNIKHCRALYVITEDNSVNTAFLLKKQLKALNHKAADNLTFIFAEVLSQAEILFAIDQHLSVFPCDLVIIDAFGDIFIGGDSNNNQSMRKNIKNFHRYAAKHESFFLFDHHINKASYNMAPSQQHIQGGGGLAQKVRFAMQLSEGEGAIRFLSIIKGNYTSRELKANAIELDFDEKTFLFTPTGREIALGLLNTEEDKPTQLNKIEQLAEEIFTNGPLSYKEYCQAHSKITGKSFATAKGHHKTMKEMEFIVKDGKKWKLNK